MQEANFQGLVKVIFWGFVIYYVFKFLARLFLPVLAKKMIDKAQEQYQNQQNNAQQNATKTNSNLKSDKPREKNKVGEYIDYEEID